MKFRQIANALLGVASVMAQVDPHIPMPQVGNFFYTSGQQGDKAPGTDEFEINFGRTADGGTQMISNLAINT